MLRVGGAVHEPGLAAANPQLYECRVACDIESVSSSLPDCYTIVTLLELSFALTHGCSPRHREQAATRWITGLEHSVK